MIQPCASIHGCSNDGTHPIADRYLCDSCWGKSKMRGAELWLELQIEKAIQHHRQVDACIANVRAAFGEDAALRTLRAVSVSTARAGNVPPASPNQDNTAALNQYEVRRFRLDR